MAFFVAGKKLDLSSKSLADSGVREFTTVSEVLKSWTMTHGFDFKTLTVVDAVTQDVVKETPWIAQPCYHAFEKDTAVAWARQSREEGKPLTCPLCRGVVHNASEIMV